MHELSGQRAITDQLSNQQRRLISQRSLTKDYYPSYLGSSIGSQVGGMNVGGGDRWTTLNIARRVRPPLLSQGMMGSSLPSRYDVGGGGGGGMVETHFANPSDLVRPEFRKASSTPARAISPALSYHSPIPGQRPGGRYGQTGSPYHGRGPIIDATMPGSYQPRSSRVSSPSLIHPIITSGQHHPLAMSSGQSSFSSDIYQDVSNASSAAPLLPLSSRRRQLFQPQYSSASSEGHQPLVHSTGDLYRHPGMMSSMEMETLSSGYRSLEHGRHRPMLNRAATSDRSAASSAYNSFERGPSFDRGSLYELGSSFDRSSVRCPRVYHPMVHGHLSDAVRTAQLITQYGVRRRSRPPSLAQNQGMMGSSLPSAYEYTAQGAVGGVGAAGQTFGEGSFMYDAVRPEFRKSSSQPVRAVSPALSLHSPTQPGHPSRGHYNPYTVTDRDLMPSSRRTPEYYEESSSGIKKRVLPQVPPMSGSPSSQTGRHHRYSSEYLQSHHRSPSQIEQQQLSDVHKMHHGADHETYPYQRLQQQESGEEQTQYQRQYSSGSRPGSGTGTRRASPAGHGLSDSEVGHLTTSRGSRRPSYIEQQQLDEERRHGSQTHLEPGTSRRESIRRESVNLQRRDSMTRRGSQSEPRQSRRYSRQIDEADADNYERRHRDRYEHESGSYAEHGHGYRDTDQRISSAELMARLKEEGNIYDDQGHRRVDDIRDHPLHDPELTARVVRRRGAFGTLEGAAEGVEGRSLSGSRANLTDSGSHQSRSVARRGPQGRVLTTRSFDEEHSTKGPGSVISEPGHGHSQDKGLDEEVTSEAGGSNRGLDTPGDRTESGTGSGPGGRKKGIHGADGMSKVHSTSTQHLSQAAKKRLGFRKKNAATFFVHRSEEVAPDEVRHMVKQASSTSDGEGSISGESAST